MSERVKFWIGDFIDNERTPVETRTGVEVYITGVNRHMGLVCGYVYDSSHRELREWDCDGLYLKDWIIDDPSFDLFFSSTAKIAAISNINLRPYTHDELCMLYRKYADSEGVLRKDTKEPFRIMHIINTTNYCYTYSVSLLNCNKKEWVDVSEKELLEHYTWPEGNPCGKKRGRGLITYTE